MQASMAGLAVGFGEAFPVDEPAPQAVAAMPAKTPRTIPPRPDTFLRLRVVPQHPYTTLYQEYIPYKLRRKPP
jgi:hypothetical protein